MNETLMIPARVETGGCAEASRYRLLAKIQLTAPGRCRLWGIGDNEWLWYFVTGNGGSQPVYSVKSVTQTVRNSARAIVTVLQRWEDGTETDAKECEVLLKRIDGKWLLDDFDGKKAECHSYVRQVREKYASGEYVKYLESAEDLKEYVPDFQARVKAFYEKYGE